MDHKHEDAKEDRGARTIVFLVGSFVLVLAVAQQTAAQQYYDSFSKMVSMTSMWQSNFYNDIIRVNAARGSFKEIAGASRITQQDVQNLCKPFPCGNETALNRAPSLPGAPPATAKSPGVQAQYQKTATDFRPVGSRIMPDEISRSSQGNADDKALLRTLSNQFLDAFEKEGRKNNIAYSFAFLTGVSLQIV